MSVKTEVKHPGEFLVSEGNGDISREAATLASGQSVVDGQALKWSTGKLVAAAGTNTMAVSTEDIAGVAVGNWTVSADTTIPYLARLAEVKDSAMTYHTGGADADKKTAVKAALKDLYIIQR